MKDGQDRRDWRWWRSFLAERRARPCACHRAHERARNTLPLPGFQTADRAGGCDGQAAEAGNGDGPTGPEVDHGKPLNACQPRINIRPSAPLPHAQRIDLTKAPSMMEQTAAATRGGEPAAPVAPVRAAHGDMASCKCGSRGSFEREGPVPAWFGDKCIEGQCPLRGSTRDVVA
jgi:hypothetical protein